MTQYLRAYLLWFSFVAAAAAVAVAWYRHVEEIGLREVAERLQERDTEDTEDTDGENGE